MNAVQDLFKNTCLLSISQIITNLLGFIWSILTINYLGVDQSGIISFAIATITMANIFMDFGMSTYIVRTISRDNNLVHKYLGNVIPLKIILSLSTIVIVSLILKILNYPDLKILLCLIIGIQYAIMSMRDWFYGIFQAFNKMKYQAIGTIINSVFLLLIIIITIYLNLGIVFIALAYLLSTIISTAYVIKIIRKLVKHIKIEFDFGYWFKTLKKSIPFAMTILLTTIFFTTDQVMISVISGDHALGIYASSYKILSVFITIYVMYTVTIFPLMSSLYNKKSDDILKISYEKSVKYLLALALPLCIGISFYAKDIIALLFNSFFSEAIPLLQVLIWNIVFVFVNGISDTVLNSSNHEMAVAKRTAIAGIFNFILNLVFIHEFSYFGAAISTLLSGLLILILNNYLISRTVFKLNKSLIKDVVKIGISSSILAIALYLTKISMWLAIPVGLVIYITVILLTKTLDKDDIYIVKELLGKNN
ncbi:MAG: oligosaccharide flippase family protein [Methanobrevibacter sp.]|jgi:O-antigen/teichoic acid export membrane protein|nr:oligosaccharide flippase family protein [Methanobrevibacter sp.]